MPRQQFMASCSSEDWLYSYGKLIMVAMGLFSLCLNATQVGSKLVQRHKVYSAR